jgi:serine protease Do
MFTFFQIAPVTHKKPVNTVRSSRAKPFFGLRISRNHLICAFLLSIVAVTKSYADNLPNFSELVETEGDAVVKISVVTQTARSGSSGIPGLDLDQIPENYRRFFESLPEQPGNRGRQGAGFGSGFIIDETGYVITNAHVVDGAVDIRVGLQDKRELRATLVGSDKASDIAVLKVDASNLPVVKIGDSDNIKVGEWVLAIGSPFGFEHTATQGIVSALSRSLPDDTYVPFIQTDVAVNPGNSGGPLFNTDGEVIGVNSQIYSRSGGYQGLSFSIPINVAMSIAEQLRETGYATRGWLGVRIQPVDLALAESFGLSKPGGALISEVTESSPAEKAGLEVGDIILTFNGKNVPTSSALPPIVGVVKPGTSVPTEIQRNGEMKTIMVTIEPLAADIQNAKAFTEQGRDSSSLGAVVAAVDQDQLKARGLDNGVVVTEVASSGAAVEAGIIPGDVIVSFNRKKVESVRQLEDLVAEAPAGEALPLLIHREQSPIFLAITLDSANN